MKIVVFASFTLTVTFCILLNVRFPRRVIRTPQGDVLGIVKTTINGREIEAYLGIPYAKPPIGTLRFKKSVPFGNWSSIHDGTRDPSVCPQFGYFIGLPEQIIENEDCLYLNVFTPYASENKKYPVLVFIPGGGYYSGGCISDLYGPDILLEKDIVLVVINYRIGILGFGSTEDTDLPGNFGLKDQVLALKWVKDNIAAYGGNPDCVTLFGQSAGSASVHFHMMSPLSKDLFHRAILMSGTAFSSWAISAPGKVSYFVKKFGERFNCSTSSTKELVNCLSDVSVTSLITTAATFSMWDGLDDAIIFTPVLEDENEESFITAKSYLSYTTVPIMTGVTTEEGAFRVAAFYYTPLELDKLLTRFDKHFDEIAPVSLMIDDKFENPGEIAKQIKGFFFGEKAISKESVPQLINMYSDVFFYEGEKIALRRHNGTAFLYLFGFNGPFSYTDKLSGGQFKYGVSHADELQYLFPMKGMIMRNSTFSEEESKISEQFVSYITNFAKHGNPNPDEETVAWTPTASDNLSYLFINGNDSMQTGFLTEREDFWKSIHRLNKIIPSN